MIDSERFRNISAIFLLVFVSLVVILQLIYIHSQLGVTRDLINRKGIDAEFIAAQVAQNQNRLRIYPLIINLSLTNKIFQQNADLQSALRDIMERDRHIFPYICDKSIENVQVHYTKLGIIVLDPTDGSTNFINDISNNRINFVLLREQLYGIAVNEQINNFIIDYFSQKEDSGESRGELSRELKSKHIAILLPLLNHEVVEEDRIKINQKCRYLLFPFIGKLTKKAGSTYLLNINIELAPSIIQNHMTMHVIGYRTL